ncbi:hypothetical protein HYV71_02125 [Candidatus Uhrbacteria bacterium]|nr:hypothetical protein [Candidatus Uhrbacteria bacterium]
MAPENRNNPDAQKAAQQHKRYYDDPGMQSLAQEIVVLRDQAIRGGVSMHRLFSESFLLPARLGDTNRKKIGQEEMLVNAYQDAWLDPDVAARYGAGKMGDVSGKGEHRKDTSDEMSEIDNDPALRALLNPDKDSDDEYVTPNRELLSTHFDPKALDVRLLRSLIKNIEHGGEAQWRLRAQDLGAARVPDGIRALLTLDMLANEARTLIRSLLREYQPLNPSLPTDYLSADQARENYRAKLLCLKKPTDARRAQDRTLDTAIKRGFTLAYLKGMEERLSDMAQERATSLYGDKAGEIMDLWRAANYLISSKFTQGDVSEFRQSVYGALKEKNLDKARSLIRPRILRNPDAFTPAAKHTLGVTEQELKATRMERADTRKMSLNERAEYEKMKKQKEDEEKLTPLKPYVGKVVYDGGHDRLMYCVGFGAIERTRASYDKKTHRNRETKSSIPAMEVRYFPRPKSGGTSTSRKEAGFIGPGEFLTRIETGEYTLREDISLSSGGMEIDARFFPKK